MENKRMLVYASKSGTARQCAQELASLLPGTDVYDLKNGIPYVLDYTSVIIGGSIRMGTIQRSVKKFIVKNKMQLPRVTLSIFICNGILAQADDLLEANIPAGMLRHAAVLSSFGGECDPEKQHGIDKIIMKKMIQSSEKNEAYKPPKILHGTIRRFANAVLSEESKSKQKKGEKGQMIR